MYRYSIQSEYELISGYLIKVTDPSLKRKKLELTEQIMDTVTNLRQHYRKVFLEQVVPETLSEDMTSYVYENFKMYEYAPFIKSSEIPNALKKKASAWYQVIFQSQKPSDLIPTVREGELEIKEARDAMLKDQDGADIPGFKVDMYPEYPVSFGWIMFDILCCLMKEKNEEFN